MKSYIRLSIYSCLLLLITACSSGGSRAVPDSAGRCEEPRPAACTREFRPVCGVQHNSLAKSYANSCVACADEQVRFFIKGACEGKKPK